MLSPPTPALGWSTIMMCLLFGTNALLYVLFTIHKNMSIKPSEDAIVSKKDKDKSKPFLGTPNCFFNLTGELFRTGIIMALTYICEKHWIFDHSTKSYSRDLFMFVCILFFLYGVYTLHPIQDLSLLSREQTEEWKGWMQFVFLLYHYFHAEEVYNSVRVMITCYVWMTGFGNFSFFFIKQDFGWLRVVQMLWRLNFSVLLLMWTHGNTWILYYICPMHTFYFMMVYFTMYIYSAANHEKWAIRFKLLMLGIIIFIIWDVNRGIFDILFSFLGTDKVIGAGQGSVWEYYFRTSLDHYSSFFGMIFAANYPLAEQYFVRAKGWPLVVGGVLMALVTGWWYARFYTLEKMQYNLYHSYTAIIPLTSYIFFRNITPFIRSSVSMSFHDLGKTTLETYLLQHHIWLTSNAKTLLTIVPGHPWVNFALATILFFFTAKELYRLTMSLRGMILPDDQNIAFRNGIGAVVVVFVCYVASFGLALLQLTDLISILVACFALFAVCLLIINKWSPATSDNPVFQLLFKRGLIYACTLAALGSCLLFVSFGSSSLGPLSNSPASVAPYRFTGASPTCLQSLGYGHWITSDCTTSAPIGGAGSALTEQLAYCETDQWAWSLPAAPETRKSCPVASISTSRAQAIFKGKRVAFVGDSVIRLMYHQFNKLLSPSYDPDQMGSVQQTVKHADQHFTHSNANTRVDFYWAPFARNISQEFGDAAIAVLDADLVVCGAMLWDALHLRDLKGFESQFNSLKKQIEDKQQSLPGTTSDHKPAVAWVLPTTIHDARLNTDDKRAYMTEAIVDKYRGVVRAQSGALAEKGLAVLDSTQVSKGRMDGASDGVHYGDDVYSVLAQMVANSYSLRFADYYARPPAAAYKPKETGSMSFPSFGIAVLVVAAIMLFTFDPYLGFGYISLLIFGKKYDWEGAYAPLLKKVLNKSEPPIAPTNPESSDRPSQEAGGGSGDTDQLLELEHGHN